MRKYIFLQKTLAFFNEMCYNNIDMNDRKEAQVRDRATLTKMTKNSAFKFIKATLCVSVSISIIGSLLIFADPTDTDEPSDTEMTSELTTPESVTSDAVFSVVTTEATLPQTDEPPAVVTTVETNITTAVTTTEKEVTTDVTTNVTTTEPTPVTTVTETTKETTTEAPSREPSLIVGPSKVDDEIKFSTGDAYTVATTTQKASSPSTDNKSTTVKDTAGGNTPTVTTRAPERSGDTNETEVDEGAKASLKKLTVISAAAAIVAAAAMALIKIFG